MSDVTAISTANAAPAAKACASFSPYHSGCGSTAVDATMSFGDFLDMVNPLQHIPVLSSIYRAATNETINPVSRIAGDTLYGGVMGLASAGLSAIGAIGDEAVAANEGHSASAIAVAALTGKDLDKTGDAATTQLADATTNIPAAPAPETQLALLQTPAKQSPILATPSSQSSNANVATASAATATPESDTAAFAQKVADATASKGYAIDRSKAAYGGVMDTSMMQNAMQNQALALAMANGHNNLQTERALRSNRFAGNAATTASSNATAPTATASTTPPTGLTAVNAAAIATGTATAAVAGHSDPIPQSLIDDLRAMKGVNQYRNTAQSLPGSTGATVDVTN